MIAGLRTWRRRERASIASASSPSLRFFRLHAHASISHHRLRWLAMGKREEAVTYTKKQQIERCATKKIQRENGKIIRCRAAMMPLRLVMRWATNKWSVYARLERSTLLLVIWLGVNPVPASAAVVICLSYLYLVIGPFLSTLAMKRRREWHAMKKRFIEKQRGDQDYLPPFGYT